MLFGVIQYVAGRDRLRPAWEGTSSGRTGATPSGAAVPAASAEGGAVLGFTPVEWTRMGAVVVFFLFAALFWGAYEQAASTLSLFADRHTDRNVFGYVIPSSWFVSIQAMFVILFSPLFAWLWVRLGPKEPSTPAKFSYGLLLVGVSFVLLIPAGMIVQGTQGVLVSPMWLVVAYVLQVAGELCLSPVGNSVVTKLAPQRVVGLMMGVWFLSIGAGNKLAGFAAGLSETVPLPTLFGWIAGITLGAAIVLIVLIPPIRRLMGGVR